MTRLFFWNLSAVESFSFVGSFLCQFASQSDLWKQEEQVGAMHSNWVAAAKMVGGRST